GDGVYRSTAAGQSWMHVGLERTRNIAKVRVHPEDPDTAYVAALGHAHGPNAERGVYRTRDGGKTWKRVLYRSERAGASDLSIDPNNPRIMYASFWEAIRRPWELVSGGPGSGLFRSSDGGDTWTEISRAKGLPKGLLGKIGVSASAAKSGRVYAIVEAEDGAVFRSDDFGDSWERCSEDRNLRQRACNQPTAAFYHVLTDTQTPYRIYGAQQDNTTMTVPSRSAIAGITAADSFAIGGGESGYIAVRADDPNVVFAGNYQGQLTRYD